MRRVRVGRILSSMLMVLVMGILPKLELLVAGIRRVRWHLEARNYITYMCRYVWIHRPGYKWYLDATHVGQQSLTG